VAKGSASFNFGANRVKKPKKPKKGKAAKSDAWRAYTTGKR